RQRITVVDEVDQIGEPLTFGTGAAGEDVAGGVSGAKFAEPDGSAGVSCRAGVAPGIGSVSRPDWVDLADVDKGPVRGPDIGEAVRGTSGDIASVSGKPRLHEQTRAVIVGGINELVIDCYAQARGTSTCV